MSNNKLSFGPNPQEEEALVYVAIISLATTVTLSTQWENLKPTDQKIHLLIKAFFINQQNVHYIIVTIFRHAVTF